MRHPSVRLLQCCLGVALLSCLSTAAPAQEAAGSSAAASSDPKALMSAASKINNLAGADVKPWHIKASFQFLDEQGKVTDEGTYEEFWAEPKRFKRIFIGKAFAETTYGSDKGDLRAGANGTVPNLLLDVRRDLIAPLPAEGSIEKTSYSAKPIETNGLKLSCISLANINYGPMHCISATEQVLRISAYPPESLQVLRNGILRFQGRTIAGDLKFVRNGKPVLTAHVETLDNLVSVDDALLTAPSNAVLVPRRITVAGGVAQGMLVYAVRPDYPIQAKMAHITGTVVLKAVIGKDGQIHDLKVVDGPDALQHAAMDAVQQWRYRPYLLNGEPVEVMTTVNVVFQM